MKRHLQRAEQKKASWNVTKYCASHQKIALRSDHRHIGKVIYTARRQETASNVTKYCTCHAREPPKIWQKLKTAEASFTVRGRSENDPTMIRKWTRQSATRFATEVIFRAHEEHFVLKYISFRAAAIFANFTKYCACYEKWHLTSPNSAPVIKSATWTSPSAAPATKSGTWASRSMRLPKSDTRPSPSIAPATKSDTWTSPSTAPATKSDTWLHQIVHLS